MCKYLYKVNVSFQTGSNVLGFMVVSCHFWRLLEIQMEQYGSLSPFVKKRY